MRWPTPGKRGQCVAALLPVALAAAGATSELRSIPLKNPFASERGLGNKEARDLTNRLSIWFELVRAGMN